ncbi:elongation of very long chain fatty acids protein 1 [Nilaparvata lugens]|uniref:elongation of very long chain fatty acids protein 1 n=1 Tax=Nilaparvata lugens TaxID=108931 RepID=UPI00193CFA70|nr:elongation of very long chain fatty acids protein 1 [Nilaparvata lugens]
METMDSRNETFLIEERSKLEDNYVDSLFLMNSPYPIAVIMASYFYFILKFGPQYMEHRKPYSLKNLMLVYNFIQVVYNGWFLFWLVSSSGFLQYLFSQSCFHEPLVDLNFRFKFLNGVWIWFLLKVIDLMDTVIFVLRKKQNQVTFLHVYHHTSVVVSCWAHIKYVRGEQAVMIGLFNSLVHTAMYMYYLLSALGPSVQPYLWWKKHITKLQLVQFVGVTSWFVGITLGCRHRFEDKMYNGYSIAQCIMFFCLFLKFYYDSYNSNKTKQLEKNKTS